MLVEKDRKWEWRAEQEGAFEELKRRFITELVLVVPDRCYELLLLPSILSLFFSFLLLSVLFIAWETLSHYVT